MNDFSVNKQQITVLCSKKPTQNKSFLFVFRHYNQLFYKSNTNYRLLNKNSLFVLFLADKQNKWFFVLQNIEWFFVVVWNIQ